jgi:hypothetical protein
MTATFQIYKVFEIKNSKFLLMTIAGCEGRYLSILRDEQWSWDEICIDRFEYKMSLV